MANRLALTFQTRTPPQWEKFIKEYPTLYDRAFPDRRIEKTPARWRLMCAIQREVNRSIRYVRDAAGSDHWNVLYDGGNGDCEEYALTKWALLLEAGFPMGAVWPVLCMKGGIGHMVTVVVTREVDYVLDIEPHGWIHDAVSSTLGWLSAYDGESWRLIS